MKRLLNPLATTGVTMLGSMALVAILNSCTSSSGNDGGMMQMPPPTLPVLTVANVATTTHREYAATLEGKVNVEIRPQVAGYLETIFIDEGEYVKAGQPLFRINDRPYREQVANTTASLKAAQANESKAQLEVDRLTPLVKNNVISEIQLQTAQASLESAKASVAQARAQMGNAEINAGFALIKAPVSGYIGHIPYKLGSLVGRGEDLPLTVLSDVKDIYAYFSLSEVDFLQFKEQVPGATLEEKLKNLPPVNLILADNTVYPEKGVVSTVEGQFDKTMGAITFRATFPNAAGLLRSGNTGRVSIPRNHAQALVVPQEATFELQDKVLVFVVSDSNKVASRPIRIKDQSATYYFIDEGLKPGEKIVYSGLSRLRDGAQIVPQHITLDSLLKTKPI